MPRTAKRVSPNRTDLIGAGPLPNEQAGNQPYGDRAQQQQAQNAIPMAPTPIAPGSATQGAPAPQAGAPGPAQAPSLQDILAQAVAHNGSSHAPLDRPTERPNEPVTHGLPNGPGAGPEALTGIGAAARENVVQQGTVAHLLQNMAAQPTATSAIRDLAARAGQGAM